MFYNRLGNLAMNVAYGFAMADMMSHSCHHRPPFLFGMGCGYFNPCFNQYFIPYYNSPYFITPPPRPVSAPPIYQPTYPQYDPLTVGESLLNIQPAIPWTQGTDEVGDLLGSLQPVSTAEIEEIERLLDSTRTPSSKKTTPPETVVTSGDSSITRSGGKVKIGKDILNRVKSIAAKINCDYKDLLGLIHSESSFLTVPRNWDGKSAVGLIQFTDKCITDLNKVYRLNLTKEKIAKMSALEQLDLAEKSLLRAKQVAGFSSDHRLTAGELAAINFLPAYAKRDVVTQRGGKGYAGNEGLDLNGDGKITKSELNQRIKQKSLCVVA